MPLSRRRGGGPEDELDLVEEQEEEEVVEEVGVDNTAPRLSREELEDSPVRPTGQMDTIRSSNQVCSAL